MSHKAKESIEFAMEITETILPPECALGLTMDLKPNTFYQIFIVAFVNAVLILVIL